LKNKTSIALKNIIKQYGIDLCNDPRRCRALLMDFCDDNVKEIRILCMALEINVPQELLSARNMPYEIQRSRLAQKLANEYAMTEEAALWCVEAWAYALGVKDHLPGMIADKAKVSIQTENKEETPTIAEPALHKAGSRLTDLDANYYIDYETGIIPIGDLPIGTRVVDPSWEWEYRLGGDYSDRDFKALVPVTWIVVAKDHYDGLEPHVTLLTEKFIGRYPFVKSDDLNEVESGGNHWGKSSNANATRVLRPWLNSTGIHKGVGFFRVFSKSFKEAVLDTPLPNKEWKNGSAYSTQDKVFIPSTTELGDSIHNSTYLIGSVYPYFQGAGNAKRVARLGGEKTWYWTRSPDSNNGRYVRYVLDTGEFHHYYCASYDILAVRPALNLESEILVSEIRN
jgi:hypothetical protein